MWCEPDALYLRSMFQHLPLSGSIDCTQHGPAHPWRRQSRTVEDCSHYKQKNPHQYRHLNISRHNGACNCNTYKKPWPMFTIG